MTTIRTTCPTCGDVELSITQVIVEPGRYRFNCPNCDTIRHHPTTEHMTRVLTAAGVTFQDPISEDEIMLFMFELDEGMKL
jgi:uncharacterized Zn finger protein